MGASKYMVAMARTALRPGLQVNFFRVIAAYGLIQGMTSDLNVAWTRGHYRLVNWFPTQFLILFSSAWTLTENYPLALVTCAIYYLAKFVDPTPLVMDDD